MAQFDLVAFTLHPTLEQYDRCRKDDLLAIAEFFHVSVPAEASKRVIKQILQDELTQQGILPELGGSPGVAPTPVRMTAAAEAGGITAGLGIGMDPGDPRSAREDLLLTIKLRELELEIKRQEYQAQLLHVRVVEIEADKEVALLRLSRAEPKPEPRPQPEHSPSAAPQADLPARDLAIAQDAPRPRSPLGSPASQGIGVGHSGFDVSRHVGLVPIFRENEVDAYFSIFERIATTLNWPKHLWSLLLQCKLVGKAQEVCSALALEQSLDYDIVKATILKAYELVPEAYRQNFRKLSKTASQTHVEFAREKSVLFDKWCAARGVSDFDQLKELVLLEEFKNCVPDRVVIYLNEQKVISLSEAATLADEFILTHKTVFSPTPLPRRLASRPVTTSPSSATSPPPVEKRECFYCHEVGHIISVCPALKRKDARAAIRKVHVANRPERSPLSPITVEPAFQPFVFPGSVSLGENGERYPVNILRDTGAAQSFLLEGIIPLDDATYCGTNVLVQGIGLCVASIPLHQVYLRTPDFEGSVRVAVQAQLPVPGITFILGNDIAGGKVLPLPEVVTEPEIYVNDVALETPDRRRKSRVCHVNMLKPYLVRSVSAPSSVSAPVPTPAGIVSLSQYSPESDDLHLGRNCLPCARLPNSEALQNLTSRLSHLPRSAQSDVTSLVGRFQPLFADTPSRTPVIEHDIDVGDHVPIKQHPYRVNPRKRALLSQETTYLLDTGLAIPSNSPWCSPCLLVPKPDGTFRFCTDYRKVNAVTRPDAYPLPRMEDCVDRIGSAKYVTKLDLLKGYWQVPLTPRASDISAFATPDAFLQYTVMAFGLRNAPATFQRLMHKVLSDVPNCEAYLDDVVIYSDSWEKHVRLLEQVFTRLQKASLVLNLEKCEFGQGTVSYLGKLVGHGKVKPLDVKVQAIGSFPIPQTPRELKRFLGMAGYYRCFCRNFSDVVSPLTHLLRKGTKFFWSPTCQAAFEAVKLLLSSSPVLVAPDFSKPFKLEVDASGVGAGAVLLQEDRHGLDHPVCYYSKKFVKHQLAYSAIEKEALALLLALQHFEVYLGDSAQPVAVYTDHNPLVFLNRMCNTNQRLMRWSLIVQSFNLEIRHKKGISNLVADALSRA